MIRFPTLYLSTNAKGSLFILCAAATFPVMGALVKLLSGNIHPFEIAFFRCLFGAMVLLPFLVRNPRAMITHRPGMHLLRGAIGIAAMLLGFTALSLLPLAEVTTLGFTRVLFLIPLAVLLLGDEVDAPRWIATAVGFGGIVLMVGPTGSEATTLGVALALASSLLVAGVKLTVKMLTETEGTLAIQAWFGAISTTVALVPAFLVWRTPDVWELLLLLAVGVAGTLGQVFTVLGLRGSQATAVMPVDYTRLIFATIYGFFLFGDLPTVWTIAGAIVIAFATLYITRRGERIREEKLPPIRSRNSRTEAKFRTR